MKRVRGYRVPLVQRQALPRAGVYLVRNASGEIIYAGQSSNLFQRSGTLPGNPWWDIEAASFEVAYACDDLALRLAVEAMYIAAYQPVWNIAGRIDMRRECYAGRSERYAALAEAGYAQPTALGAGVLFLLAVLIGLTTAPGQALAFVFFLAVAGVAFNVGRGLVDSARERRRLVPVEIYPALDRRDAHRVIDGWHR